MGFAPWQAVHACFGLDAACVEAACLDATGSPPPLASPWPRVARTPSGQPVLARLDRSARSGQISNNNWPAAADRGDLFGPWAGCLGSYNLLKQAPGCAGCQLVMQGGE